MTTPLEAVILGNSLDQLRHPRSDAYSAEQVLLNKQQISGGGAYLDCYLILTYKRAAEIWFMQI